MKPESLYARDHERNQRLKKEAALITTNTVTVAPEEPKTERSGLVIAVLILLAAAFVLSTAAALFSLPYLALFAIVDGLAAVAFSVLSLREDK